MLLDKEFLSKLDKQKNKTIYARITSLTFQETPIEYIEGRVTQGSINLDGASAVRRSCSLTMVAVDFNYKDYYWGLNTKFKLEIGVKNDVDSSYPEIIWFNKGIYLITSFNTSRSASNFTISIQGKDKMCQLNGEIGGTIESSVDFGTIEEQNAEGNWIIRKLPIPEIIKNLVHTYGGEPYHNIIINDLEAYGLELLEYRLTTDLYLYREFGVPIYKNSLLGSNSKLYNIYKVENNTVGECLKQKVTLKDLEQDTSFNAFEVLVDSLVGNENPPVFLPLNDDGSVPSEKTYYYFSKISYGETAGYRLTDLVFAGDLIANIGESVTSVLDKIKNMLTEFEYFYNTDGQFVFQKKQSFKETLLSFNDNTSAIESFVDRKNYAYEFFNGELITAFNNNPNLSNLKNDYSIWGERESISGAKIPIHLRYAIDIKPTAYTQIMVETNNPDIISYNQKYNTNITCQTSPKTFTTDEWDWREIIYQMAKDYYKYNMLEDFELRVAAANPELYPTGRTGYEEYYIDLQGFWRQLYYPGLDGDYQEAKEIYENLDAQVIALTEEIFGKEVEGYTQNIGGIENDLSSYQSMTDTEKRNFISASHNAGKYEFKEGSSLVTDIYLFESMLNDYYFRQKYDLETVTLKRDEQKIKTDSLKDDYETNFYIDDKEGRIYWNKSVYEAPDQLNFWFDFLDTSGELQQFSVRNIGTRSKAINDTSITSIYFRDTPSIIYKSKDDGVSLTPGYRCIQIGGIEDMFTCSAQGKSAKNKLDELIYEHGYCTESATITSIPIYYLEPNTRIYLHDGKTGLEGDYIISKLTIPLAYNGTMSITATKAAETII